MNAALSEKLISDVPEPALLAVQILAWPFLDGCASIQFLDNTPSRAAGHR
jgi:hypothetical protein